MKSTHQRETQPKPWLLTNPLPSATIAGGMLYLIFNESYRSALLPFGITPTEVGIDYSAAVWPAAQVSIIMGLLLLPVFGIAKLVDIKNHLLQSPLRYIFALFATIYTLAIISETRYISAVTKGKSYRHFPFGRLAILPALRSDGVNIQWKDANAQKFRLPIKNLLLLGSANGTTFVYASETKEIYRIPSSEIVAITVFNAPEHYVSSGGPRERQ